MKNSLEFWFEFGSTYSYPAAMRIQEIAIRHEIQIVYRPFLLGPIFKKQGWDTSPFIVFPAKGIYMWRDLERICEEQEIPFRKPSSFPRNGLLASRIVCAYENAPWIPEFTKKVYHANFALDQDISSEQVLTQILTDLRINAPEAFEMASLPRTKEILRIQTDLASDLGIFGAPTFRVGNEIFWGNDRLEAAIRWQKRISHAI